VPSTWPFRYWTWVNHLVVWASILLWLPFIWLYGLVWPVGA
jgi:phospholipid-translocating ATPase/phospholipid-transporting ATPase